MHQRHAAKSLCPSSSTYLSKLDARPQEVKKETGAPFLPLPLPVLLAVACRAGNAVPRRLADVSYQRDTGRRRGQLGKPQSQLHFAANNTEFPSSPLDVVSCVPRTRHQADPLFQLLINA
jgi:hypothetical protein